MYSCMYQFLNKPGNRSIFFKLAAKVKDTKNFWMSTMPMDMLSDLDQ